MSQSAGSIDAKAENARILGGLRAPEPKHMPTLFTLIIGWFILTTSALVTVPYAIFRGTDSYFTDGNNILFWSAITTLSTAHGAMAYIMGYRKGAKVLYFVLGGLLMPVGLLTVFFMTNKLPDETPPASQGVMKTADRFAFAFGNIWWGISQLVIMFAVLIRATIYESQVGGGTGNVAAYAAYYNTTWFGLIFVVFFATLYCATMRKYPFRISQAGWLLTHAGLLILVIGCLTRYWGMYSGFVRVMEGETVNSVGDRDVRELTVRIPTLGFQKSYRVETDNDPATSDKYQKIEVAATKDGKTLHFDVALDRYYAEARFFERIEAVEGNNEPNAVAELRLAGMGGAAQKILLDEKRQPQQSIMEMLTLKIVRATSTHFRDSLVFRYAPEATQRGALVVRRAGGEILARVPVIPGKRDADPAKGAKTDTRHALEDGAYSIVIGRYYSQLAASQPGQFYDATPGEPTTPGITFRIDGPEGSENHSARSDGFWFNADTDKARETKYPFEFEYECRASNMLKPMSVAVVAGPDDDLSLALVNERGVGRIEPYQAGREYRFSSGSPFAIVAGEAYANGRVRDGVEPTKTDAAFAAVRATVFHGDNKVQHWVPNGLIRPRPFVFKDTVVTLQYEPRRTPLGFDLSVIDFRKIDYPNSKKPSAYETNAVLQDDAEGIKERVLIDMNHPLKHRGYRFFNSSPFMNSNGRRGVGFSVTRDPGYGILLLGSAITSLGLLVVFFFKPRLRRIEKRRQGRTA